MELVMHSAKEYLEMIKDKFNFHHIEGYLSKIGRLSVLVLGDAIIDNYVFVKGKGRATKDLILSVEFQREEFYPGGILAIANHISSFVKNITLVTSFGEADDKERFARKALPANVTIKSFIKPGYTTVKRRYIDAYKNQKLFKVEFINEEPLSKELSDEIIAFLDEEIHNFDLVVVGDFGHGFVNDEIRRFLEENAKFLSIQAQSNSSNIGYHSVGLYRRADYLTMNETELRMPLMNRHADTRLLLNAFSERFGFQKFLVTIGKKGSIYFDKGVVNEAPVLVKSMIDTLGAGDAVFAISSLFAYIGVEDEIMPLIANGAGGIMSNTLGNKSPVTKAQLVSFLKDLKIKWPGYKEKIKQALDAFEFDEKILDVLRNSIKNKQRIFIGGNGGSASIASHYVCDFSKGATKNWQENFNRYRVVSLSDNISYITAISNDKHYEDVFKQQLINLAEPNDILVMISSSGNSPNVISALRWAKEHGMITIGISGFQGGKLKELSDYSAHITWPEYETCEDIHGIFGHFLATYLREFEEKTDVIGSMEEEDVMSDDIISKISESELPTLETPDSLELAEPIETLDAIRGLPDLEEDEDKNPDTSFVDA